MIKVAWQIFQPGRKMFQPPRRDKPHFFQWIHEIVHGSGHIASSMMITTNEEEPLGDLRACSKEVIEVIHQEVIHYS